MTYNPPIHNRHSMRIKGYDYSKAGYYFVTICTHNHEYIFGEIEDGEIQYSEFGQIAAECWRWLGTQYEYVELDEWVLMPNHLHGIIILGRGGSRTARTVKYKALGSLIGAFKTTSTKIINELRHTPGVSIWQRNYYEHVVRGEEDLNQIRQYILENPIKWDMDEENPHRRK